MTRSSERNEQGRLEYTNDNPDPRFRPSVSRLLMKLREMPQFEDPAAVAFIIDDMMYRHFVFLRKDPGWLWYLAKQAVSYWNATGGEYANLETPPKQISESPAKSVTTEDVPEMSSLPPESRVYELYLERKELKRRIRDLVIEHTYEPYVRHEIDVPACACGKEFEFIEQWANHLRARVWMVMRDQLGQAGASGSDPTTSSKPRT